MLRICRLYMQQSGDAGSAMETLADSDAHAAGKTCLGRPAAQESPELAQSLHHVEPQMPVTEPAKRQQALELRAHDRLGQPRQLACANRCAVAGWLLHLESTLRVIAS